MKYEITEEQIKELAKGNAKVKKWYPEFFELQIKTGWYKHTKKLHPKWINFYKAETDENYGIGASGKWLEKEICNEHLKYLKEYCEPATDSEVLEALKNEAVKRGFKEGVYIHRDFGTTLNDCVIDKDNFPKDMDFYYDLKDDYLECYGFVVYSKGQWATIIQTYTKEEAEKLLNGKIV